MDSFKTAMVAHFQAQAPQLGRWRQRHRYYYRDLERLHRFLVPEQSRVLAIGCGTGDLLASLNPSRGVGLDFIPEIIEQAQARHPQLQFVCADAETLTPDQVGSEPFEVIILCNVLGYLSDIQAVLQRLHPLCTPRTRLILSFHNFLWEPLLRLASALHLRSPQPPQNWLSMGDVVNLLQITGYDVVKQHRRCLLPVPLQPLAWLCNRYFSRLPLLKHFALTNSIVARPPAPKTPYSCSVIIPARNEAGNIEAAVQRTPQMGKGTEIIFVEGHSRDETWAEIQRVQAAYADQVPIAIMQQTGKGKGDAVRLGFAAATGDIVMILDADLTVPPEALRQFYDVLAGGRGEFLNGSRLVYPRSYAAMPWLNAAANKFFASVFSFLLDQPLKDTLCGTKVLLRRDYERLAANRPYFGEFDPFGDFDLLFGAAKLNLQIVEVPVRYQPRSYGESNIAHVKEGLILLQMCLYASRKIKFF